MKRYLVGWSVTTFGEVKAVSSVVMCMNEWYDLAEDAENSFEELRAMCIQHIPYSTQYNLSTKGCNLDTDLTILSVTSLN